MAKSPNYNHNYINDTRTTMAMYTQNCIYDYSTSDTTEFDNLIEMANKELTKNCQNGPLKIILEVLNFIKSNPLV